MRIQDDSDAQVTKKTTVQTMIHEIFAFITANQLFYAWVNA